MNKEANNLLIKAAQIGSLELVQIALDNGGSNCAKDTDWALRLASRNGHKDVVELLKSYM